MMALPNRLALRDSSALPKSTVRPSEIDGMALRNQERDAYWRRMLRKPRPPLPWRAARTNRVSWMGRPLLLVTTALPSLEQHDHPNLGRLVTPRHFSSIEKMAADGWPWAADNDCFQSFDIDAYGRMLDRLKPSAETCLFVAVPDVVGDAIATAKRFELWTSATRRRGLPSALVAQDGLEDLPLWLARTWHRLDALFIGGTTEWKMGPHAAAIAQEAKRQGLWVHWGRVNTRRRFDYIRSTGACDSFDGSKWAVFRKTYLDEGLAWTENGEQLAF